MKIATDNMKGMKNYALERLSKNYAKIRDISKDQKHVRTWLIIDRYNKLMVCFWNFRVYRIKKLIVFI